MTNRFGSQSGQAIIEYILVLIVTVMLVLGGMYQLNTAFKSWAQGYFGDYIACLLETGELPDISGAPGDSGTCKSAFKTFNLADGKSGLQKSSGAKGGGAATPTAGTSENRKSSSGGGGGGSGGHFSGGSGFGSGNGNSGGRRIGSDSNYTGNTAAGNNNSAYGATNRRLSTQTKERLDNRFAFDNESVDKQKRRGTASVGKSAPSDQGGGGQRIQVKRKERSKDSGGPDDSPMTFGNFLRILLIAAIVIALVTLIGGQMLQVGKSME